MWAFKMFLDSLPKEKAAKTRFILHTEGSTDAGTDLYAVKEYLSSLEKENFYYHDQKKATPSAINFCKFWLVTCSAPALTWQRAPKLANFRNGELSRSLNSDGQTVPLDVGLSHQESPPSLLPGVSHIRSEPHPRSNPGPGEN